MIYHSSHSNNDNTFSFTPIVTHMLRYVNIIYFIQNNFFGVILAEIAKRPMPIADNSN